MFSPPCGGRTSLFCTVDLKRLLAGVPPGLQTIGDLAESRVGFRLADLPRQWGVELDGRRSTPLTNNTERNLPMSLTVIRIRYDYQIRRGDMVAIFDEHDHRTLYLAARHHLPEVVRHFTAIDPKVKAVDWYDVLAPLTCTYTRKRSGRWRVGYIHQSEDFDWDLETPSAQPNSLLASRSLRCEIFAFMPSDRLCTALCRGKPVLAGGTIRRSNQAM